MDPLPSPSFVLLLSYKPFFYIVIPSMFYCLLMVAQMIKNLPVMRQIQIQSLGPEDPLEKGMTIHFSVQAWRIPWTEELGGRQSMGLQRGIHN